MLPNNKFDLCVLGAGSAGLSVAAVAAQMGVNVVLIEANKMGGDCLNYGCVPSKSLLAAAKTAQAIRRAERFGIEAVEPKIDIQKVMQQVQNVINTISAHDSEERYTNMGVTVIKARACFQDSQSVIAGERVITARRFVIATGSSPAIPTIPGLDQVPFFTNETIFNLTETPSHLIIIGGGPIGCELAQAFLWLGIKVTVLEMFSILPKDEPELVDMLRSNFLQQSLTLHEHCNVLSVQKLNNSIGITIEKQGSQEIIEGSHLLVAAGRKVNVQNLNLDAAGIQYSTKGLTVDKYLRTTNPHVYAIGDVAGSFQFTHIASYHAGIVIRNILFRLPAKVNYTAVPWVTYTDPELAHVGLLEAEALKHDAKAKVITWNFNENDRAQTERTTFGKIKVITTRKGKVLGVSILGPHAGELLLPWINIVQERKSIRELTKFIVPYPTLSEISKRAASEYYAPKLFSKMTHRLVRVLSWFG